MSSRGESGRDCFLFINELWSRRAPCPNGLLENDMSLYSSESEDERTNEDGVRLACQLDSNKHDVHSSKLCLTVEDESNSRTLWW